MQQVLVLNSGSSSLKFQLFLMPDEIVLCSGLIERIGFDDAKFIYKTKDHSLEITTPIKNHKTGLQLLANQLLDEKTGIIKSAEDIDIVGHRVVHGGKYFSDTTIITAAVKEKIEALASLAPLHNPANLEGIKVAESLKMHIKSLFLIPLFINLYQSTHINMRYQTNIQRSMIYVCMVFMVLAISM